MDIEKQRIFNINNKIYSVIEDEVYEVIDGFPHCIGTIECGVPESVPKEVVGYLHNKTRLSSTMIGKCEDRIDHLRKQIDMLKYEIEQELLKMNYWKKQAEK